MFAYLRYFAVISFFIVTLAAVGLGVYFRQGATEDLRDLVLKNNKVLVQGFINNVWKSHRMVEMLGLFDKHGIPRGDWHKYRGYKELSEEFGRDVFTYFEETPIVQVSIYTANGEKIVSMTQGRILSDVTQTTVKTAEPENAAGLLDIAKKGEIGAKLLEDATFELVGGEHKTGTIMQTILPILSDKYVPQVANDPSYDKANNVEGMVEIYYDLSRQWEQVHYFQYLTTGAIIAIFVLLIVTLVIMAAKAETIITKQHEANLELAAQAASAEAENQNKSQFLANISHELRTPLNAIIGFSEIIKDEVLGAHENQQYKDYIKDIHQSGVHLLSLINDILDYSKAEAGKLDLNIEELDITKLILSSMRLVSPRAEQAQVELAQEIPEDHYIIKTDAKKFKQIMLNLLSNAVKFTPPGGKVKVTLWQNVVDGSVSVEVRDTGIGIAPKNISRALAPFGQVDSALSRKYEGTGLGLPLTKKFIEIMGGAFQIQSEENVGTAITFTLPAEPKTT